MALPYLDPLAREEMVADQFLRGLDNHELRVQVATSDVRWIEDLMRIAYSLEAVEGEEMGRGRARRSPMRARFTEESEGRSVRNRTLLPSRDVCHGGKMGSRLPCRGEMPRNREPSGAP